MMKRLLCVVITVMIMMSVCTTVGAENQRLKISETSEQRVERIYPNWKEDYEQWNNKELVDRYDVGMRALVVAVIEHESRFQGNVGEKYRGLMQIRLFFQELGHLVMPWKSFMQEDLLMYSRRLPQRAHLYLEYVWECSFYLIVVKKLQVMLVVFQFFRERFVISQRTQI